MAIMMLTSRKPSSPGTLVAVPSMMHRAKSSISTANFSFYTVVEGDLGLLGSKLTDQVDFTWQSLCAQPGGSGQSCPVGDQHGTTGGASLVVGTPTISTALSPWARRRRTLAPS